MAARAIGLGVAFVTRDARAGRLAAGHDLGIGGVELGATGFVFCAARLRLVVAVAWRAGLDAVGRVGDAQGEVFDQGRAAGLRSALGHGFTAAAGWAQAGQHGRGYQS